VGPGVGGGGGGRGARRGGGQVALRVSLRQDYRGWCFLLLFVLLHTGRWVCVDARWLH
jgi:hypothetical protein